MALNRPVASIKTGAMTSVVLGHDKGPHVTTYHQTFELNMPKKNVRRTPRFTLPPSEIFHRTQPKCPLTVHQASFGDTPSQITYRIYQERKRELKEIMGIHKLLSVPMGRLKLDYNGPCAAAASQMHNDYVDRHHVLHDWTRVQHPQLPQLPPIRKTPTKQGQRKWFGHVTEAAHQFRWPDRDELTINEVKFRRGSA